MKNLTFIFFSFIGIITLFIIYTVNSTSSLNNVQMQDKSIIEEISRVADSIDLYIENKKGSYSIACGDRGSWSDYSNENDELLKTESDFMISKGILLSKEYYKSDSIILSEIVFFDRNDTIYWENRYYNDKGFYSEVHVGSIDKLSLELSNHIKKYHYHHE